jgi:hypothetical protein
LEARRMDNSKTVKGILDSLIDGKVDEVLTKLSIEYPHTTFGYDINILRSLIRKIVDRIPDKKFDVKVTFCTKNLSKSILRTNNSESVSEYWAHVSNENNIYTIWVFIPITGMNLVNAIFKDIFDKLGVVNSDLANKYHDQIFEAVRIAYAKSKDKFIDAYIVFDEDELYAPVQKGIISTIRDNLGIDNGFRAVTVLVNDKKDMQLRIFIPFVDLKFRYAYQILSFYLINGHAANLISSNIISEMKDETVRFVNPYHSFVKFLQEIVSRGIHESLNLASIKGGYEPNPQSFIAAVVDKLTKELLVYIP